MYNKADDAIIECFFNKSIYSFVPSRIINPANKMNKRSPIKIVDTIIGRPITLINVLDLLFILLKIINI